MKILLGCDAVRYPLTGIGRYAFELARGVRERSEVEAISYFIGSSVCDDLPNPHPVGSELVVAGISRSIKLALLKSDLFVKICRHIKSIAQSRSLSVYGDFVYHGPNYYLPPHSGISISTFHDLSMFKHPDFHPESRVRYMAAELPVALRRANLLITDCEYIRQEVIEYSGFSSDRVHSVPLAASPEFAPRSKLDCAPLMDRLKLNYDGFCLFAGTIEPRKNIGGLLDAYEKLPVGLRQRYPLVLAGYKGWKSELLHARMERAERSGWLKYLGFVSDSDLPLLFSAARVFAFPSFYEGFGLPVLEAMASGVPVVCSNSSSLPEASGGNALMCDPGDVDALSMLLTRALLDEDWRQEAILKGRAHAAGFSWQRVVSETLDIYRLAATF